MRCCGKTFRSFFFSLILLLVANVAAATDISIRNPQLIPSEEGFSLAADINVNINPRLEDAIKRGIVLYFAVDFELTRSRWYWFDEQIIRRNKVFQLSYHALTRQYRLSTGALHQSYATLDEAVRVMSRLRNWQVLEKGEFKTDYVYLAGLRMSLDLTQMPKTFQVSALSNKDWNLSSDWQHWTFTPAEAVTPATPPVPSNAAPIANVPTPASEAK